MRLPLVATLILLIFDLLIDYYIHRRLRPHRLWRKVQDITAVIFNLALVLIICWPKRRGDDASLEWLMWGLYAYFSVYLPKLIFVVFDLLGAIPRLWHRSRIRWMSLVGVVISLVVFVAMWWGALINRFNLDVRHVEVEVTGLPEAFDGFTIAQISDMHVGTYGADTDFVAEVVDRVNSLDPDVIAFTGDIVNRKSSELIPFVPTLSELRARNGVYSILGNHDYGDYYNWPDDATKRDNLQLLIDMQRAMGWKMLNNSADMIYRDNDSIALIGVENVGDPPFQTYGDLDRAYATLGDPVTKILLSHNPAHWVDDIKDAPDKNIALTLSGHTHAMQISAFGVSPAAIRYPTWGGLYSDNEDHQLYVNIGIGEVGVPARIGATPEITLITLRRK